ncbi:MAG: hypothetical protein II712_03675 [Erysipelotrichaceae bacterium]|nr:hypothetical protein [Erysipelotrichaceae bacterium]
MSIICLSFMLAGCGRPGEKGSNGKGIFARTNKSGVCSFSYGYDGTIGGNNFSYDVRTVDGEVIFTYHSLQYDEFDDLSTEIDPSVLEKINEAYLKHKAARWDGYSKYNCLVSDGSGFSMSIGFNDGESMSIHGMNCYPAGYRDFENEILPLFGAYRDQMIEEAKRRKIENGVSGELTSFMANFFQYGSYGSDKYEILIMSESIREKNVDIQITSESGDFIEKGKYNFYFHLPDEEIGFENFRKLIEKYNVVSWMDYDKNVEDNSNREWFQISFGFQQGSINAMGSLPPENYSEFRNELLSEVVRMLKEAIRNHPEIENRNI